jgi:Cdc6-like AAA superfamily ATPase
MIEGLKVSYFTLNPSEEFEVFFVRSNLVESFVSSVRRTVSIGKIPKAVVYGPLGIGKTQFARHVMWRLKNIIEPLYIETPPMHRRSRFTDLYSSIMRNLGRDYVLNLLKRATERSVLVGLNQDLRRAVENGLASSEYVLWKYLCGFKLLSSEVGIIQATYPQINEDEAVSILNTIGAEIKALKERPLVLFLDEFENTRFLGGDGLATFREAVRGLTGEGSKVGVVFFTTGRQIPELTTVLWDESVRRRIGVYNFYSFEDYTEQELKQFVYEVIKYRRNEGFDVQTALKRVETSEHIDTDSYPFTKEAIDKIVEKVVFLRHEAFTDTLRPKEAMDIMDKALALAIEAGEKCITAETVERAAEVFYKSIPSAEGKTLQ